MTKMMKRTALLVSAVAVTALALPAIASATVLKQWYGVAPVGTSVKATGVSTIHQAFVGEVNCSGPTITAQLLVNSGGSAVMGNGSGEEQGCVAEGLPIPASNILMPKLSLKSPTSGAMALKFTWEFFEGTVKCEFQSSSLQVTYKSGTSSIHASGPLSAKPEACSNAEEPATFEGDFALSAGGSPVIIE